MTSTLTSADLDRMEAVAKAATQGEWHHVNPGVTLPKTRTVHGTVPAERVDYVSTWPGLGTPDGHRVVVPQARETRGVRVNDMAHIATFDPPTIAALLTLARRGLEAERLREALEAIAELTPATQEICTASMMGDIARQALGSAG